MDQINTMGVFMYIVGLIVYVAFLIGITFLCGSPTIFLDLPSIVVILGPTLALLLASGLMPDFMRGFAVMSQKENTHSRLELQKADIAVGLTVRLLLLSGLLGSLIGVVALLAWLSDISTLGRGLSVALLTLLYAVLFCFILLPIRARIRAILHTLD